MEQKELVILDLDGVIIKGQSQKHLLDYLIKKRVIGLFFYLKIYLWFVLYRLGLFNNPQKIMEYALSFLKNRDVKEFEEIIRDFVDNYLRSFIFLEMIDIINKHKEKGRELLILSNSINFIVKNIAKFLDVKNYIGTSLEIMNGRFTGNIIGSIVYGKNKNDLVYNFVAENNLELKNSWAYTDHISDIDLLMAVKYPNVVNPNFFLLKEAKKRDWNVLFFK